MKTQEEIKYILFYDNEGPIELVETTEIDHDGFANHYACKNNIKGHHKLVNNVQAIHHRNRLIFEGNFFG